MYETHVKQRQFQYFLSKNETIGSLPEIHVPTNSLYLLVLDALFVTPLKQVVEFVPQNIPSQELGQFAPRCRRYLQSRHFFYQFSYKISNLHILRFNATYTRFNFLYSKIISCLFFTRRKNNVMQEMKVRQQSLHKLTKRKYTKVVLIIYYVYFDNIRTFIYLSSCTNIKLLIKEYLVHFHYYFRFGEKNQCHAILFWRASFKIDKLQAFCLF